MYLHVQETTDYNINIRGLCWNRRQRPGYTRVDKSTSRTKVGNQIHLILSQTIFSVPGSCMVPLERPRFPSKHTPSVKQHLQWTCVQTTLDPQDLNVNMLEEWKCVLPHTREKLIYGFSFKERRKRDWQHPASPQRPEETAYGPAMGSGKPAMAQNPPVSGNPVCFALSCASSHGHKQIPRNTGNVCSLWVLEKFWNSEGGEGGREAWANKESFEDKHARTLAFHLPFPGLMDLVTLWPQPHQPHTNQNQISPLVTNSLATVPYAPATRTRTPEPVHREGTIQTGTCEWGAWWPFHDGFLFYDFNSLRSEPIRRH